MFLASSSLTRSLTGLAALVLAAPAVAQVTITCDQAEVTSRVPCVLTASHGDGKPRAWKWSVVGLEDAAKLLEPLGPDRVRVRTPVTLVERSFTVVAEDSQNPSVTGTFVLRITPNPQAGSGERALTQGLFPSAFTPSLVPFLEHPERRKSLLEADPLAYQIAFCDDETMGGLNRCWLLARGLKGLEAYKVAGDPVAIPGFPQPAASRLRCMAVATLPPGPGQVPAGAPRVVFCEMELSDGFTIYALEADGRRRFLAGGHGMRHEDGPGETARFAAVGNVALDRQGNVYVCGFADGVRKISLDRRVSTLWLAHPGRYRTISDPQCLAIDPATGELYVAGDGWVDKLTPEGRQISVLGVPSQAQVPGLSLPRASLTPVPVPPGTRFDLKVRSLAVHGRELFMATSAGICAFHLDTRRLALIVPCDQRLPANRMGPVHYLNPHLPAARCAALEACGPLALTKEALCVVSVGEGIAELELPDDPVTSIMDPRPARSVAAVPGAGAVEHKGTQETKATASPLANLWPGKAPETGTVRADGQWGAIHWRRAAQGQRFSGQCQVEAGGLTSGWAQISLLFVDAHGKVLGHSEPAGPGLPDVVSAPVPGRTWLRMTGTAPKGTDRVALCLKVAKGNPGAGVVFHDVAFHQLP